MIDYRISRSKSILLNLFLNAETPGNYSGFIAWKIRTYSFHWSTYFTISMFNNDRGTFR